MSTIQIVLKLRQEMCLKDLCLLLVLIAALSLMLADRMTAQTFTTLHSFTANPSPYYTNSDGAFLRGGLILSGNTLYGTAIQGGSSGAGTLFAVPPGQTSF